MMAASSGIETRPGLLLVSSGTSLDQTARSAREVGVEVVVARDGDAALRALLGGGIDLVICDVSLSEADAFEICRAIRQAPATRELTVLLVDGDGDRERALKAGATGLVSAPLDPQAALALLRLAASARPRIDRIAQLEGLAITLARGLDDRDPSSAGLAERVAHWTIELGASTGLSEDDLALLYKAAILHDIGRLGVPQSILLKPGPLQPEETEQVRRHAVLGEEILQPIGHNGQLLPAVRHHHERWDGDGYPDRLDGERIPLFARIIAIADAFVALTSDRPYRARRSKAEAAEILRRDGGRQWDGRLAARFLELVEGVDIRRPQTTPTLG
jgi:putative two-component system response regulator